MQKVQEYVRAVEAGYHRAFLGDRVLTVCVCVCVQPWTKGLPPPLFPLYMGRGTVYPTEVTVQRRGFCGGTDISSGRGTDVPAFNTLTPLVHPAAVRWFHGSSSRCSPTNRFLSAADRRLAQLCSRVFRVRLETMFNHTVSADFSTLRFFAILPIGEIELTEYKLSKCVPLSRPTRVLSVIPVTGAPILHGKATTPTHHRSLDSHRKAPTPSQNQLPHRPPGQKTVLEEYFGFQLSDFSIQISFHVFQSCACFHVCYVDAAILSSTELKDGHYSSSA